MASSTGAGPGSLHPLADLRFTVFAVLVRKDQGRSWALRIIIGQWAHV
jgi:hypothetical protein